MESRFNDYRRLSKDSFEKKIKGKLAILSISKEMQQIDKSDLLVSSHYISLYPSTVAHKNSKCPKIETAIAIKN